MSIFAFDPTRRTNARAIADAAELGFIRADDEVLDLTIGHAAGFWKIVKPELFVTNDLDLDVDADLHFDATKSGLPDNWCDVASWDCPYGYRGTTAPQFVEMDTRFGLLGKYKPADAVDALLGNGTIEACRIARRIVLVKCQDSCVSAAFRHQTAIVASAAERAGATVAGQLHVSSVRPQPTGKKQRNVWASYSTLMILRVGKS